MMYTVLGILCALLALIQLAGLVEYMTHAEAETVRQAARLVGQEKGQELIRLIKEGINLAKGESDG